MDIRHQRLILLKLRLYRLNTFCIVKFNLRILTLEERILWIFLRIIIFYILYNVFNPFQIWCIFVISLQWINNDVFNFDQRKDILKLLNFIQVEVNVQVKYW